MPTLPDEPVKLPRHRVKGSDKFYPAFPTCPGKLPHSLDPLNWRHYLLPIFWVFFQPTALKCYLYQSNPKAFFRNFSMEEVSYKTTFRNPAYRQLVLVSLGSMAAFSLLITTVTSLLLLCLSFPVLLWRGEFVVLSATYASSFRGLAFNNFMQLTAFNGIPLVGAFLSGIFVVLLVLGCYELPMLLVYLKQLLFFGIPTLPKAEQFRDYLFFAFRLDPYEYLISVLNCGIVTSVSSAIIIPLVNWMLFWQLQGVILDTLPFVTLASLAIGLTLGIALRTYSFLVSFGLEYYLISYITLYTIFRIFITYDMRIAIALSVISGIILGFLRVPFHIAEAVATLLIPNRILHPIWWDELAILPFIGVTRTVNKQWQKGEEKALTYLSRLTTNPFQYWVLQQTLIHYLENCHDPISFIYRIFRQESLKTYVRFPLKSFDLQENILVRDVYFNVLACKRVGLSYRTKGLDMLSLAITKSRFRSISSPIKDLVAFLNNVNSLWTSNTMKMILTLENSNTQEDQSPLNFLETLVKFPGGSELKSSFVCITHSLQATSLKDITQTPDLLSELPPPKDAIRPEVIEALQRLGPISQNIAVAQAASSQLNRLAAFARATEALEELGPFIEDTVVLPEKVLLLRIRNHWRSLVAEGGGRLGQQVQHQRVVNPYVAGNPVKGSLFVGRDEILGQLEELWLKTGQVDSLVLFGHRRMGKSSILQNLPHRLDPAANWVVDFNLQTVNRSHTGSLLFDLATKMRDQLLRGQGPQLPATNGADLTVPEEAIFRDNYQRAFNQWLDRLAPLVTGRRFIIAVDEYELLEQAMADGRLDKDLTEYLRGVIQTRDWFVLALAGLYTLQEQCHDYWHPLFASIKPRKVSFLSPAATRRLLTQPSDDFPLDYAPDTLDTIQTLTNGQPYLVQLIGQNLVALHNRQVREGDRDPNQPFSLADLQAVIESPEFFEDGFPYFNGVWGQAQDSPPGQHTILRALAAAPADEAQLAVITGLSPDAVHQALNTLEAHDVITLTAKTTYTFTVDLMRRWVAQRSQP